MRLFQYTLSPILGFLVLFSAASALSQTKPDKGYPSKPIRLIVPQAAGGSNDIMARGFTIYLGDRLGKPVVVDNRSGAEGIIGTEIVSRSAKDGYTLLMASAAFTMNPALKKLPYDSLNAFEWVGFLGSGPTVLTTGSLLAATSVKEILSLAKSKPGFYTMASAGGFQHFASALFKTLSGQDFTIVLYKGGMPAMVDVMGGQAHMTVGSIVQAIPHIRTGRLKPIATGGLKRTTMFPELPTIHESGVPNYEAANWWAIAAPTGVSTSIIMKINNEISQYLKNPEVLKRFNNEGVEIDMKTPDQISRMIKADLQKWASVAKSAGMKAD